MCQLISGIAVKSGDTIKVYTLPNSDSHRYIREYHNIRDDGGVGERQTPIEYVPGTRLDDSSDWEFRFNDERPNWWTDDMTKTVKQQLRHAYRARRDGRSYTGVPRWCRTPITPLPDGLTVSGEKFGIPWGLIQEMSKERGSNMCRLISGIAVKSGDTIKVYTLPNSDSHSDIREYHNIRDDGGVGDRQTPIEGVPGTRLDDISDWKLTFNDERPNWWTDGMTEIAKCQLWCAYRARRDGYSYTGDPDLDGTPITALPDGLTVSGEKSGIPWGLNREM